MTISIDELEYLPRDPRAYRPAIGLIGCGEISAMHLAAYRVAGYNVVALCDLDESRARARRDEYFPTAAVYTDASALLARTDIEVVDLATHVDVRPVLVRAALDAGKHVLSQKPFVVDLDEGDALIRHAAQRGRRLAVNQNGRWAPHFAFLIACARSGIIGDISTADFAAYWPHDLIVQDQPAFATMHDLILWDFGIHWFDVLAQILPAKEATSVNAHVQRIPGQAIPVPTAAATVIAYPHAQATVLFRGASHHAEAGGYRVEGTRGVITHAGASLGGELVEVHTDEGRHAIQLDGTWWSHGMHGTMAELLSSIEDDRMPSNDASTSMDGLRLCFAALESAQSGHPVDPRALGITA
jgi:predicted dehydrogenase